MASKNQSKSKAGPGIPPFILFLGSLVLVLGTLFFLSFSPSEVIFSNDNPLGAMSARWMKLPQGFFGLWLDVNSIGLAAGALPISPTYFALWGMGALLFAKFFVPLAIAFVGLSAWLCFRRNGLSPVACFLGGLAALLNSGFFSAACWGVIPQTVAFGMDFLAVAALAGTGKPRSWIALILAGLAVGLNVMEASDIGALFSLMIAGYVLYQAVITSSDTWRGVAAGVGRTMVVAVFAGLMAAQAIFALVTTQIQGAAGMKQDPQSKAEHWNWATQWSLPKRETLSLFVPGLYGYRMDTPRDVAAFPEWFEGGIYWGAMGRDAAWQAYFDGGRQGTPPNGNVQFLRHTGGGNYAGVLVVLVAVWAAAQAFRKKDSVFPLEQRKLVWFWTGSAVVSLLLAYGHHAPFYRILYALPYFSTIRNPTKFLQLVDFSVVILFAYGIHGLSRRYLEPAPANERARTLNGWWAKAGKFDKRWVLGCAAAIAVSMVGWLIYSSSRAALVQYLQTVQFDETLSRQIAGFSIKQLGWFVLFLGLGASLLIAILSGRFAGQKARWGVVLLGLLLVMDLMRANLPWVLYWDYKQKYASNEVVDFLRQKPYEHRVAILPGWITQGFRLPEQIADAENFLGSFYGIEWAQHHFLYYNVQSLDIVQMPRVPQDLNTYNEALWFRGSPETVYLVTRRWELTNTRYLLGVSGLLEVLNKGLDPGKERFRIAATFNIVPKVGVGTATRYEEYTAVMDPKGAFAVFEFTGALPRASLFANWQTASDEAALKEMSSKTFDPAQKVLVADSLPAPAASSATNAAAGTVEYQNYAPTKIMLQAKAKAPSVLLLNDKFDPNWKVWVDDKPAVLLRCNFIMRGVQVPAGEHRVEFRYAPPVGSLYVTIAAGVLGLALLGFAVFVKSEEKMAPVPAEEPALAKK